MGVRGLVTPIPATTEMVPHLDPSPPQAAAGGRVAVLVSLATAAPVVAVREVEALAGRAFRVKVLLAQVVR
jgi:hypothetical protein